MDMQRILTPFLASNESRLMEISVESGVSLADLKQIVDGHFPPHLNKYSTLISLAEAVNVDYIPIASTLFVRDLINLKNLNDLIKKNYKFEKLLKICMQDDKLLEDIINVVERYEFENF